MLYEVITGNGARIHRVEIPYGRFSRRVLLPNHRLELAGRRYADGCLTLTFAKRTKETRNNFV